MAAAEVAVRGGCALGKATVRPSGFWPYCTGWNNLEARVRAGTAGITEAQEADARPRTEGGGFYTQRWGPHRGLWGRRSQKRTLRPHAGVAQGWL